MSRIGIADTTFARINMAEFALNKFKDSNNEIERYTVPGIKDLPVACKILFDKYKCDIVMALGMVGTKPIDKQCSHESSLGIQMTQLMANKHIIEVFIHPDEAKNQKELYQIAKNRTEKHSLNVLELLKNKTTLTKYAGMGKRQGKDDEGSIKIK